MTVETATAIKVRITGTELDRAFMLCKRGLPTKATLPALYCCLLSATEKGITLTTTDVETRVEADMAGDVLTPGSVLVTGEFLSHVRGLIGDLPCEVSIDEKGHVLIDAGEFCYRLLQPASVEDFPLPETAEDPVRIVWESTAGAAKQVLRALLGTAPKRDHRRVLEGIHAVMVDGRLMLTACDGKQVYRTKVVDGEGEDGAEANIPRKILDLAAALASANGANSTWRLELGAKFARLIAPDVVTTSLLVKGKFPSIEHVLRAGEAARVTVPREAFLRTLRQSKLLAYGTAHPVRLTMERGRVLVSSEERDKGAFKKSVEVEDSTVGEPVVRDFIAAKLFRVIDQAQGDALTIAVPNAGESGKLDFYLRFYGSDDPEGTIQVFAAIKQTKPAEE